MVAIAGIMPLGGAPVPVVALETVTETSVRGSGQRRPGSPAHRSPARVRLDPGAVASPAARAPARLAAAGASPGKLLLTEPDGTVMYDGECGWPSQWRDAAREWGYSVVLAGSTGLYATRDRQLTADDLTGMLTRAATAGELTGALAAFTEEPGRS
jgi:hypothetical protein